MKNYYSILGLERDASVTDIRKAYRKRALELHPDINNNEESNSEFLEISEAYQILKNINQRKRYDLIYDSKIADNKFHHFTTRATNNAQKTSKMNTDNFKKKTERSAFFDGLAVIIEPIISLFSLF